MNTRMPRAVPKKRTATKKIADLPHPTFWVENAPATNPVDVWCLVSFMTLDDSMGMVLGRWSSITKAWLTPEDTAIEEACVVTYYSPIFLPSGVLWRI